MLQFFGDSHLRRVWRLTRHAQLFSSKDKRGFSWVLEPWNDWLWNRDGSLAPSFAMRKKRAELQLDIITYHRFGSCKSHMASIGKHPSPTKRKNKQSTTTFNAKYLFGFPFPASQIANFPTFTLFFSDFPFLSACQSPRHFLFGLRPTKTPQQKCSQLGAMVSP